MCGEFVETRPQIAAHSHPSQIDRFNEMLWLPLCPRCEMTSPKRWPLIMRSVVTQLAWRDAGDDLLAILARLRGLPW